MLKNILKLEGAQKINAQEQKNIDGGITRQCADAIANGCDLVPFSVCQANGGLYSPTCKCCMY